MRSWCGNLFADRAAGERRSVAILAQVGCLTLGLSFHPRSMLLAGSQLCVCPNSMVSAHAHVAIDPAGWSSVATAGLVRSAGSFGVFGSLAVDAVQRRQRQHPLLESRVPQSLRV